MTDGKPDARPLQFLVGLAVLAVGVYLVMSPTTVANALDKPHDTGTRMINLRASWGGTVAGLGLFLMWLPAWSPRWRVIVTLLMWTMAGIGAARLLGFALDGSPDTRQYIWIVAEIAIVAGCAFALRRRR